MPHFGAPFLLAILLAGSAIPIAHASRTATHHACPISAPDALPEFTGRWRVLRISGLDQPRPDSLVARAVFVLDLQRCLIREEITAETGNPPYEALVLWGVNGPQGTIQ